MPKRFIDVFVEEHEALPDGCMLRFQAVDEPRAVHTIHYAPLLGEAGRFRVEACFSEGGARAAQRADVEDSGAGTCTLIWGGDLGIRLQRIDDAGADSTAFAPIAEPYLLLAAEEILDQ
jgi:hypothetical protein